MRRGQSNRRIPSQDLSLVDAAMNSNMHSNRASLAWATLAASLSAATMLGGCASSRAAKPQAGSAADKQAQLAAALDQPRNRSPKEAAILSVKKANQYLADGRSDDALAEFERAIESNPTLTVAFMGAGDIYREKGDYSSAEQRYGKAAQIEPQNFDAQYLHGLTLQLLTRAGDAVKAYLRALTIKPDDFNANLNIATAYLQLRDPSEAVSYAERAVRIKSDSAPARTNLGAVYYALTRYEDAVIEYQQAAELAPLTGPLLLNLADALGKSGRIAESVNTLQQLVKTSPSAVAFERLGAGYFKLRRYEDSKAAFSKAVEIDGNHYPAINGAAVCLLNQYFFSNEKDEAARQEAIRLMRRSLQIERQQPKIVELLGRYN
jgi:tetratricopeptide (TPR) repeat protein